jgi:hypothetical protein
MAYEMVKPTCTSDGKHASAKITEMTLPLPYFDIRVVYVESVAEGTMLNC